MRTLLNIIWLVLCGWWMALLYTLAGIVMCLLIITIPFGLQAFKLAGFMLWPFGRTVVRRPDAGAPSVIGNVIWLVLVGWELAIGHLVSAVLLAITIIGIPLALANLKLVPVSLLPFGRRIVPVSEAKATGAAFI
ncbi:MAG TPA: YccF domain-containing protein [Solirubrobacteraceae bacterium]|nr:YccF domain-containing protein [Solirubrobacteraceae bacterium]